MNRVRRAGTIALGLAVIGFYLFWSGSEISPSAAWTQDGIDRRIFWLRLPRMLIVLLLGGALSSVGATYQTLFRNPLADPYLLGISSAVTLGAAIAEILLGAEPFSTTGFVFGLLGALILTGLLVRLGWSSRARSLDRILLFGIGVSFVLSASLFLLLSYQAQALGGGSLRWLFGQIGWPGFSEVAVLASIVLLGCGTLAICAPYLDILGFGDGTARSLTVAAGPTRAFLLVTSSVIVAFCVLYAGAIGFVGLVVPHLTQRILSPRSTRMLILSSFAVGAVLLVFSDGISRSIAPPMEFPIGVITTILGGPVFLYLLWRQA